MCLEYYRCYSKLISSSSPIAQYLEEMGADFDPEIVTFFMERSTDTAARSSWALDDRVHPYQTLLCEKKFPDYAECKSFLASQGKLLTLH